MVNLKALEAAINQVETIRDYEFTFEVDGQKFTLRPLRSYEETEVQRYAEVAWEGAEEGSTSAYQDFMDRVRLATLGFSVVGIGGLDLSGSEWIETGDLDEHGNPISVPKGEAVRDLIREQWTKALVLQVFAKFGELLERVEFNASRFVKFDPSDLDEEIARLEKRTAELKDKREERLKNAEEPAVSGVHRAQKAVAQEDERNQRVREAMQGNIPAPPQAEPQQQEAPPAPPHQEVPQPEPRRPAAPPQQAAPPERAPQQPPQQPQEQPPQQRRSAVPQHAAPPEREPEAPPQKEPEYDRQGIELPPEGDSFFDPSDPDGALEAETRRFMALHHRKLARDRERAAQAEQAREMGMPTQEQMARDRMRGQRDAGRPQATNLDPRVQGLRQAANLQNHVPDTRANQEHTGRPRRAQPQANPNARAPGAAPATLHGKEVYKMPTQTLERPARARPGEVDSNAGRPQTGRPQVNPEPGGVQDKFRPPNT